MYMYVGLRSTTNKEVKEALANAGSVAQGRDDLSILLLARRRRRQHH